MDTNQIDKAVSTRARVRINERNGWAKSAEGTALGFRSLYGNIKVGFVDADGHYTGEYTMVHYTNVDIIENEDATQQPRLAPTMRAKKTTARRRPTVTEARIKRHMKRAQRRATVATRKAASAAHRDGLHTIASHLRALGVDDKTATGMAETLRKKATGGIKGFALKDGVRRACTRYTRGQFLAVLALYRPRKPEYKDTRARLLALAA